MAALRVIERRKSLVLANLGPLYYAFWTGVLPIEEDVTQAIRGLIETAKARGSKIALFAGVPNRMPVPTEEIRTVITTEMSKLNPHLLVGATLVEREGFAGSAVRAVVSTMQLLSRADHPERVFATGQAASKYLARELERAGIKEPTEAEIAEGWKTLAAEVWV